ncbi:MAG: hypothetical protein U0599_10240 [Vicinamibacteria bacterium]
MAKKGRRRARAERPEGVKIGPRGFALSSRAPIAIGSWHRLNPETPAVSVHRDGDTAVVRIAGPSG